MGLKIGLLTMRGVDYHPNRRLSQAAEAMGHEVVLIQPYRLSCRVGPDGLSLEGPEEYSGLDVVLPRQGATLGNYSLVVIGQLELMGLALVNGRRAVSLASDKFLSLQELAARGLPVAKSVLISQPGQLEKAVRELGGYPLVLKLRRGRQGSGVSLLDGPERADLALATLLKRVRGLLLQEFIDPKGRRDLRVLVVGGRVAGAMELTPVPGQFKANFHQGGRAKPLEPDPELAELALEAARILGLEVAGIDLMVDAKGQVMVSEANYAPGFKGLEQATGKDIASRIIEYAVRRADA